MSKLSSWAELLTFIPAHTRREVMDYYKATDPQVSGWCRRLHVTCKKAPPKQPPDGFAEYVVSHTRLEGIAQFGMSTYKFLEWCRRLDIHYVPVQAPNGTSGPKRRPVADRYFDGGELPYNRELLVTALRLGRPR